MEEIKTVQDYTAYMQAHPELTVCPIRRTLDVMGGKWKIFIVLQLFGAEQLRFGELAGAWRALRTPCSPTACGSWRRMGSSCAASLTRSRPMWNTA